MPTDGTKIKTISLDEIRRNGWMNSKDLRRLRKEGWILPMAGGSPEADDVEDSDDDKDPAAKVGSDDDEDDDEDVPPSKRGKGKTKSGSDDEDDSDDDDEDDDYVRLPKSQLDALRKENAERRRAEKKREKDEKASAEKRRAEQGQWQEQAEAFKSERDSEKERADKAEQELADFKRDLNVERVAKRLNMLDPEDAVYHISRLGDDDLDLTTEADVERGLKRVRKAKPKLFGERGSTGAPLGNSGGRRTGGKATKLTKEDIEAMSTKEINENWDEVQAFLKGADADAA